MRATTFERIYAERKAWARNMLVMAWGRVEHLASISAVVPDEIRDRADNALREAAAVAEEWGMDPQAVVDEATR